MGPCLLGLCRNITLDQHGGMVVVTGTVNGGQVTLIIDVKTPLSGLNGTASGTLSAAVVFHTVTPEPGTMLLFGSGLLLVAGVLRRKLIA